jgi:hypothetical protein
LLLQALAYYNSHVLLSSGLANNNRALAAASLPKVEVVSVVVRWMRAEDRAGQDYFRQIGVVVRRAAAAAAAAGSSKNNRREAAAAAAAGRSSRRVAAAAAAAAAAEDGDEADEVPGMCELGITQKSRGSSSSSSWLMCWDDAMDERVKDSEGEEEEEEEDSAIGVSDEDDNNDGGIDASDDDVDGMEELSEAQLQMYVLPSKCNRCGWRSSIVHACRATARKLLAAIVQG